MFIMSEFSPFYSFFHVQVCSYQKGISSIWSVLVFSVCEVPLYINADILIVLLSWYLDTMELHENGELIPLLTAAGVKVV